MPRAAVMERPHGERAPPAAASDAEVERLTAAIARGDASAFGAFYEAWFDRAYLMARTITRRDESFCLDVVQDSMLRVVRSLRPLPSERRLRLWLARVIHSTAIDHLRREVRRARHEGEAMKRRLETAGERDAGAGREAEVEEQLAWLEERLGEISAAERSLLVARFGEGRTLAAAGAEVGLSGNAAHGRIRRAIERLRALARRSFA